jgi:hypothetical protein
MVTALESAVFLLRRAFGGVGDGAKRGGLAVCNPAVFLIFYLQTQDGIVSVRTLATGAIWAVRGGGRALTTPL